MERVRIISGADDTERETSPWIRLPVAPKHAQRKAHRHRRPARSGGVSYGEMFLWGAIHDLQHKQRVYENLLVGLVVSVTLLVAFSVV